MINLRSISAVFWFELRKAAGPGKIAIWLGLAAFPILLSLCLKSMINRGAPSDEKYPEVRVTVKSLSERGLPELEINGEKFDGIKAIAAISKLGEPPPEIKSRMEQFEQDMERFQKEIEEFQKERMEGRGRKGRRRFPRPPRPPAYTKPILIVRHPAELDTESQPIRLLRVQLERAFSSVVMVPEGEDEPNVQPPTTIAGVWMAGLFVLIPSVVSMLGVLLWATPAVSAELERRSWIYLATRPDGPVSVLLGKYLVGVCWGISAALISLAVSLWIADIPEGFMYLFKPLALLVVLGCPAYGAIYLLLGVIMPRRAMVLAVVYSIAMEGVISFVPAMINKVTVQFRLRSLMIRWIGLDRIPESSQILTPLGLNETSTLTDIAALIVLTVLGLTAAVFVLQWQELSQADESDS